jgi:hypothetical protein
MTSKRRIKLFRVAFLLLNGQDVSIRSHLITDISLISAFEVKGRDTKYCTIKAKDALLQEYKKLDSKKGTRSSFVKQKQIERNAIIVVSWGLHNRSFATIH